MAKRSALLVLWLVMWVGMCWCWGEEAMDNAKETMKVAAGKAGEVKQSAAEAMQDAKDNTDYWADWAYDKFTEYIDLLLLSH